MKRKDNKRTDSERSDDTYCSQDTTITTVCDNSNSETPSNIKTITEQDEKIDQEKVTFDLGDIGGTDVTSSVANVDNAYVSLHHENVKDKAADTRNNKQFNELNSKICKCCSSCYSVEQEPLLGEENAQSTSSIKSLNASPTETKDVSNPISHAKTFPLDIQCSGCRDTAGACRKNVLDQRNNADNTVKSITENYTVLKASYRKILRILVALAVFDLIMVICVLTVVPTVAITTSRGPPPWKSAASRDDDPDGYNICFDCADLEKDKAFSAETLRGVHHRDGSCCFKSITSVYLSLKQVRCFSLNNVLS